MVGVDTAEVLLDAGRSAWAEEDLSAGILGIRTGIHKAILTWRF